MPSLTDGILIGMVVLVLDFLAWRLLSKEIAIPRLIVRSALFCALSYVLFRFGMSPFGPAPWAAQPLRHALAQLLELMWWIQGAQLLTVLLDRLVLPEAWHRERLFQDVLGALVFLAAAVAAIAYVLELPVRGLLATSGALAVILGLAIQSTLNDVFSGVVLNATQPFRLGDWVLIGAVEGKVVESNWRATSLLNSHGNIVVIPNSVAAKANIVNNSRPAHMHGVTVAVQVGPEIRPGNVLEALEQATLSTIDVLASPKPLVSVRQASTDAIEYEILCYVDSLTKKGDVRNALFDLVHRHLSARDIDLRSLSVPRAASDDSMADPHNLKRLLRRVVIFQTLDNADLEQLQSALTRHEFEPGDTIYASSDSKGSNALHIVASGVAKVMLPRNDQEVELRRMAPGDSIGQSGILAGLKFRVTVRAVTRVVVFRLAKEALSVVLERRPEIAGQMCRLLTEHHASEETLLADPIPVDHPGGGVLEWLKEGMHRLHNLAD
jgi:small-conductance mechanosensitive channel